MDGNLWRENKRENFFGVCLVEWEKRKEKATLLLKKKKKAGQENQKKKEKKEKPNQRY